MTLDFIVVVYFVLVVLALGVGMAGAKLLSLDRRVARLERRLGPDPKDAPTPERLGEM